MLAELAHLRLEYWVLLLVAVTLIGKMATTQWRKVRQRELDLAFKRELLDQDCPLADIERLLRSGKKQRPVAAAAEPLQQRHAYDSFNPRGGAAATTLPHAAGDMPLTWLSFGAWYKNGIGRIPVVVQLVLWVMYGFAWIPGLYVLSAFFRFTTQTSRRTPTSVLPAFAGAAFFVATVFASISGLVVVCSLSPSRPSPPEGEKLAPESWVVPVVAGGEGSCRILVGRNAFTQGFNLEVTALVIAQSNPASKLRVQINPDKLYLYSMSGAYVTAKLRATGEPGDFTVQVSALDKLNKRVSTIFTVQARPGLLGDGGQFAPSGSLIAALGVAGAAIDIPACAMHQAVAPENAP